MTATSGMLGRVLVAASGPDPDRVSPGVAGFVTVFLLALAVFLLIRSMVKHLRNVRYGPGPPAAGGPGGVRPEPGPVAAPESTTGSAPESTTGSTPESTTGP